MFVIIYLQVNAEDGGCYELRILKSFLNKDNARRYLCELSVDDEESWDAIKDCFTKNDVSKMSREEKISLLVADKYNLFTNYGFYQIYVAPNPV